MDKLTSYIGSERYIQSIHLFDRNGKEFRVGGVPSKFLYDQKDEMMNKAEGGDGSNVWISLENSKNSIFSARQIKSYQNLSLEKLGTLIVDVKLHEIVKELPREWEEHEGFIAISKGEDIFYTENTSTNLDKLQFSASNKQGYQIQNIYGRSFFVTYSKSPYANWTYWNVLPFGTMFAKVTMIKFMVIFLFLTISISSIF